MKPRDFLNFFKTKSGKLVLFVALFGGGLLVFSVLRGNSGKIVLNEMLKSGSDPVQIVKEKNLAQVSDTGFMQDAIEKVLNDNPKEVEQFLAGK